MVETRVGSEAWQVALLFIALTIAAFCSIEGWWAASQREVRFCDDTLVIRRWSDILLGRPGSQIPVRSVTAARLVFASGRRLELVAMPLRVDFWVGLWPRHELRELREALATRGITLESDWEL